MVFVSVNLEFLFCELFEKNGTLCYASLYDQNDDVDVEYYEADYD
jgi:hypothetical protein